MPSLLIAMALASGIATIASDWRGVRRPLFYLAKPLTTVFVIALAFLSLAAAPAYRAWVLAALACCLVGDIALMFTGSRAFVLGLSSFLLGHLLFIAAFLSDLPHRTAPLPAWLLLAASLFLLPVAAYARWLLPRTGRLKSAVGLYLCALTAMVLAALWRAGLEPSSAAAWVCLGALLFAVSDAVLAWRKFVAQPWWGQPVTLLTYYLAIGVIAWAH